MKIFPDTLPNPAKSWWREAGEVGGRYPQLQENIETDTLIIGAGLTGLSCAYYLSKDNTSCVVIEAGEVGWGASGRNGGQVIPGLKLNPHEIEQLFSDDLAEKINTLAGTSADRTFSLIEELGIECQHRRTGWIQGAHSKESLKVAHDRAQQWSERGAHITLLDKSSIYEEIGGGDYCGGWIDHRGGSVQPYLYTRGLGEKVAKLGVRIYERTKAEDYKRSGSEWVVTSEKGIITCKNIVFATNGYSDTIEPKIKKSVIPMLSLQGATEPLTDVQLEKILPNRRVVSETRRLLNYYHIDSNGRLLFGSTSNFRHVPSLNDNERLKREISKKFPQLESVNLDYTWNGRLAITKQHLPKLQRIHKGVYAGYGFNGRGVALSTVMGEQLSLLVRGASESELSFPLTLPEPYVFQNLHAPVADMLLRIYKIQDLFEMRFN